MGTIRLIVGVTLFLAVIVVGIQVLPPFFTNYQFEDEINNAALTATYGTKTEEEIRTVVYNKAKEMEIPVTPDQIKVNRIGTQGTGSLAIEVNYTVHVNLPGYPMDLAFHAATKNKGIY